MLAEDSLLIRMATAAALEDAGYDVLEVSNGPEALELIEARPGHFSCLISDLHMPPPAMTGSDLAAIMRKRYPSIPMILTSAWSHLVTDEQVTSCGLELIPKPYDPAALVRFVQERLPPHRGT